MNIRDLNPSADRPDRSRSGNVGSTNRVTTDSASRKSSVTGDQHVEDSVEISGAARAAMSDEQQVTSDVTLAKKALLAMPPLSEDEVQEIITKVQQGYYDPPNILKQISEKAMDLLLGLPGDE